MTLSAHAVQAPAATSAAAAEAARYALLRRLAPSMRHHLVVNLQPIGMVCELLDRRLRATEPRLTDVRESAQKINGFARAALASSQDVVTWLAPEEGATTTAADGVRECLALVATSFSFRGFALRNEVGAVSGEVSQCALRNLLTGALLHLADENRAPAEIVLSAAGTGDALVLAIALRGIEGDQGFSAAPAYRLLTRADLQALADAEAVRLEFDSAQALRLTFPWATPPAG